MLIVSLWFGQICCHSKYARHWFSFGYELLCES